MVSLWLSYKITVHLYGCPQIQDGIAESAIHLLLRLKPHSVHSLPWNTLCMVALICMAAMVQGGLCPRQQLGPMPSCLGHASDTRRIVSQTAARAHAILSGTCE